MWQAKKGFCCISFMYMLYQILYLSFYFWLLCIPNSPSLYTTELLLPISSKGFFYHGSVGSNIFSSFVITKSACWRIYVWFNNFGWYYTARSWRTLLFGVLSKCALYVRLLSIVTPRHVALSSKLSSGCPLINPLMSTVLLFSALMAIFHLTFQSLEPCRYNIHTNWRCS